MLSEKTFNPARQSSINSFTPAWSGVLQRKCACGGSSTTDQCAECSKKEMALQRRSAGQHEPETVPPIVYDVLRSPGQPLDAQTRAFFEPRFGHDFSQVRVHTDASAAASARAVNALAYTVGRDVVFGAGQHQPATTSGMKLLAHELAHSVQQGASSVRVAGALSLGESDSASESEAIYAEENLGFHQTHTATGPSLHRKSWGDLPIYEERPDVAQKNEKLAEDKPKKTPASCTRTIFAEGTCADLVAGSKFICCDPTNGMKRAGKKTDIEGTTCPDEKFTPIFTCDNKCDKALAKGCSDNDNWMAMPSNQFTRSQCGDTWTICANGKQTTGYVRDHSVTKTRFEVSPKIQKDLGVTVGSSFKGAVYRPGAKRSAIDKDTCCNS